MKVDNVANNIHIMTTQNKQPKVKTEEHMTVSDKLELSAEARSKLKESNLSKIDTIRANIAAGKYNSDDVIGKVVDFIVKDLE